MSMESAQTFIEKMKTDQEFAAQIKECQSLNDLVALAKQAGFDFSADEAQAAVDTLSDEELDGVAGGKYVRKIP